MYGTKVPRSKLGLDLRPGTGPECGTRMPKCELGLRVRIACTAPHLISLLLHCPHKLQVWISFPDQCSAKIFPNNEERQTQHIIGCSAVFLEISLPGICAWVGTKFQSHKLGSSFSPKYPLRTDNIGPHYRAYLLKLEPSSKATTIIFHSHLNSHLRRITLDL